MNNFKLEPADILVTVNRRNDPFSKVKRWVAGPYDHVFLYMGKLAIQGIGFTSPHLISVPMLFESAGRGVAIQSLSNRYRQEVVVMRLKAEADIKRIPRVLREAIKLASEPSAYYDYLCLVSFAIPRLICEKLGLPLPLKYQRNPAMICSEACAEVFIRGGLELLYLEDVPLPGDFVTDSLLLEKVWAGRLSEELV
ncbi:unnamed protein product [marine sediment metagenome]|uniref:Uncharacterized protein n=1 Tax=marine sediment metagenome TaxID=412755 RepID=X1PU23_9ZZZZ